MHITERAKKVILVSLAIILGLIVIRYFSKISSFFLLDALYPILLGCIVAYILNILLCKIEGIYFPKSNKKIVLATRRPISILISILILIFILAFAIILIIPELSKCIDVMEVELPLKLAAFKDWADENIPSKAIVDRINEFSLSWDKVMPTFMGYFQDGSTAFLSSVFNFASSIIDTVTNIIIAFVFAIYILFNKEKLQKQFNKLTKAYFKTAKSRRFITNLDIINDTFSSFIVGQCTEAVILGILCFIGMSILRFPYALITGVVVGLFALIPILGALIGAVVGAFLIFTESPFKALMFLIFLVILQQCEEAFIYPKVVGKSVGLPGMWVLFGITVGGGLFGIIGMLLGVPIVGSIYKILQNSVNQKLATDNIVDALKYNSEIGEAIIVSTDIKNTKNINEENNNKKD